MKDRRISSTLAALTVTAAGFAGVTFTATPASAASCYGGSCDGHMANNYGCGADAITAYSTVNGVKKYARFQYGNAKVELRYSAACYAFWARVTLTSPGWAGDYLEGTGYDNGVRVHGNWIEVVQFSSLSATGQQALTAMWGRRSAARYSWGAKVRTEGSGAAEIRWPVTGVIWS
ncbi:hypothetical protein GCM10010439_03480 [Actinocorallia aurantiaca]|uniref:DUF2690 domain-containing protein n=2 Tax=Actinocorallia aurantiaca TaxID=46204 RepID=A0ABN3TTW0_9ACTN